MSTDPYQEEELEGRGLDRRLLGWMLTYARPERRALAGCVLLLAGLASLELTQPYLIKTAIDRVLAPGAGSRDPLLLARLWPLAGLYLASVIGLALLQYLQALWLGRTGQRIIAAIRQDVFDHVQRLSLSYFDRQPAGRVVTRVTNDVEALNEMYTSVLVNLFRDLFVMVGGVIVLVSLNARLALVALAVMPLVAATAWAFQKRSRQGWRVSRRELARINATLAESFSGMRVIQLFGREAAGSRAFSQVNQAYHDAAMQVIRVFAVFGPALDLLTSLALAAVIWYGGGLVLQRNAALAAGGVESAALAGISFGTLYAVIAYLRRLFDPLNALAQKYNILQSALAAAERLSQLLATRPEVEDPARPLPLPSARRDQVGGWGGDGPVPVAQSPGASRPAAPSIVVAPPALRSAEAGVNGHGVPAVAFEGVWFAYQGEDWVLRDVSFQVARGETVAFVGHTGAGKSTIMNLVPRFYDVQRGRILVSGRDVREVAGKELRRRVGIVMQDVFLFAGDVAGNISLLDPAIDRVAVETAARQVGADRFVARLPGGLDEPVVERGLSLSTGQRQLISFARALAYDPDILILDEATANIDTETEDALQQAVRMVARDRTLLVVAHRLATVRQADRIHVMHKGRIVESGDHAGLLAADGRYAHLWRLQFESA
ncbi:MAG TPA: ABC transporter ATP-binding protein [Anaerolineae bacterium]|nr:ABC transporter ATP-binding protein [Anaerolineae bacterium]HRA19171.1 ABC transporter ATP-binding protein [Anaerolineae bacterium]